MVHNRQNLVAIPTGIHQKCVSALMGTRLKNIPASQLSRLGIRRVAANRNLTLREYQRGFSYENLHLIGLRLLTLCGVEVAL